MASSPFDKSPRKLWRTVRIGGAGALLMALAACAKSEPIELEITLPATGYVLADGSLLSAADYKSTRLMWGTCGAGNEIDALLGEVDVDSQARMGVIEVDRLPVCVVAVVIGLDDQPMGRSDPEKYPRPAPPKNLTATATPGPR